MLKRLILAVISFCITLSAAGQLLVSGEDPASIKWNTVKTNNYKLIYPRGIDSLAYQYAMELEKYHKAVGISIGFLPGEQYRAKTPVILHAYNGVSNGSVSWLPKKMEFYTLPSAVNPDPLPWITNLAIHESRHLSQMQFAYEGWLFKPLSWLLGEMAPGATVAVYPGSLLLEGDAVVAETALTNTGRGREADFLNYYRVAWQAGDKRKLYEWLYGSYKKYTPSCYPLGYTLIAGTRVFYDDPLFTKEYFERINKNPIGLNYLGKQIKSQSNLKTNAFFNGIMDKFVEQWQIDNKTRAPFIEPKPITKCDPNGWYIAYSWVMSQSKDKIYAVRNGLREPFQLVLVNSKGEEEKICAISRNASGFTLADDRIYWSEVMPSLRWEYANTVVIKFVDLKTKKIERLTNSGRLFNPSVNATGEKFSATEFLFKGGSELVVFNADNGHEIGRYAAPDSLQLVESVWLGSRLFVSGISPCGLGLYELKAKGFEQALAPAPRALNTLYAEENSIRFTSDRTGVDEVYSYNPDTKMLLQQTSTLNGVKSTKSKDMIVTYLTDEANGIYIIDTLLNREVAPTAVVPIYVADVLTEQEKRLGAYNTENVEFMSTKPRPYRKVTNLVKFHSWAPVHFKADAIEQFSFSTIYNNAGLGATALFQNELGTMYGYVGYSYDRNSKNHPHGGYIDLTYSGLFPVFNFSVDVRHRAATQYNTYNLFLGSIGMSQIGSRALNVPSVSASAEVYLPLNFSYNGWNRGLVPRLRWTAVNDYFSKTGVNLKYIKGLGGYSTYDFAGVNQDDNVLLQNFNASLRFYTIREMASQQVFPRLGLGVEVGYNERIGLTDRFSPAVYTMLYGYLPGILPQHGMKFMVKNQQLLMPYETTVGESYLLMLPRGFKSDNMQLINHISSLYESQVLATIEYAIPIGIFSIYNRVLSVRNLEAIVHCDIGNYNGKGQESCSLTSTGLSLAAVCPNFLWIPYTTKIGLSLSFNGGDLYERTKEQFKLQSTYVGGIFTISF